MREEANQQVSKKRGYRSYAEAVKSRPRVSEARAVDKKVKERKINSKAGCIILCSSPLMKECMDKSLTGEVLSLDKLRIATLGRSRGSLVSISHMLVV